MGIEKVRDTINSSIVGGGRGSTVGPVTQFKYLVREKKLTSCAKMAKSLPFWRLRQKGCLQMD